MGSYLICNYAHTNILSVRESEVLFRSDIAEHRRAEPSDLCRSDSGSDMVVTGCDIGNERSKSVERCIMALLDLALHILFDFVERHMTRTLYKCLYIIFPSTLNEFAESVEFRKLCFIISIVDRTGTETIAKRNCNVVLCKDFANFIEMLIKEALFIMDKAPFAHDRSATANYTGEAFVGKMHVMTANTGMNSEIVDALLALLDKSIAIDFPREVFYLTIHFFKGLIDRYSTYRNGAISNNPLTSFVNIGTCREVHQRVAAPFTAPNGFIHLFIDT